MIISILDRAWSKLCISEKKCLSLYFIAGNTVFGGYSERVTPVPIPNTEVKPLSADGTAFFKCGRVGTPPELL